MSKELLELPRALEQERTILGTLLVTEDIVLARSVFAKLSPDSFTHPDLRQIFGVLRAMTDEGLPPSIGLLITKLGESKFMRLGADIASLTENKTRRNDLSPEIRLIQEASARRKALRIGNDLISKAQREPLDELARLTEKASGVLRGATSAKEDGNLIEFRCLSDFEAEDVEWLWFPYLPLAKLTLLEGDPGIGKS